MTPSQQTVAGMKLGLVLPNKGAGAGPELLDAAASATAEVGWNSLWVTDHLMVPRGEEEDEYGTMLEALTTIAWVGGRHPALTIGTSVVSPAMRDAPLLAKELATIDVLLGGRLVVGVGVSDSGDLQEYRNMGKEDRFRTRGAYVDETIRLWRHLWSGTREPFEGEFHTIDDFTFAPLPLAREQLPVWCGGRSRRALRRTAELCDGYHAAQTSPDDLRERMPQLEAAFALTGRPMPVVSTRARVYFDRPRGDVYAITGSPEEMAADLVAFREAGNDELIVVFDAHEPDALAAQIRRFADDVVARADAAMLDRAG
ncbi:LLM class flavin-dependent oxidoreductase [Agromyces sp. SYSU T00194]|uniref:LLM class flavin-dependent oxidoreductase n=1 Tax=Agromyces chitinivorans TaxID=3158560 RepID=UPI003390AEAC